MAKQIKTNDPLREAVKKLGKHNIDRMDKLRIAKKFANIGDPFVGFEGRDPGGKYFCLRVDYDPEKEGHVNLTINESEKYEYFGETSSWSQQVVNNINGGAYCGVSKDKNGQWETEGQEKNSEYIAGMKKYMNRFA